MKKYIALLILFSIVGINMEAIGQMSKKEEKVWKKKIKSLKPEELKSQLEDLQTFKEESNKYKGISVKLQKQVDLKNAEIESLEERVEHLNEELAELKISVENRVHEAEAAIERKYQYASGEQLQGQSNCPPCPPAQPCPEGGGGVVDESGIVFKVQIGAFKKRDLSMFKSSVNNFNSTTDENGISSYNLGIFRDYYEANIFKKHLREMGIKDAFVVSFQDGQKVPLKNVITDLNSSQN